MQYFNILQNSQCYATKNNDFYFLFNLIKFFILFYSFIFYILFYLIFYIILF